MENQNNIQKPIIQTPLFDSQLKFPLDKFSERIIKDLLVFPVSITLPGTSAATAGNYGVFFTNNSKYNWEVLDISESHSGTASATLQIERLQGTEASDSGDLLLETSFNLASAANTVQHGAMTSATALRLLQSGDRLGLKDIGTLTNATGLNITTYLRLGDLS